MSGFVFLHREILDWEWYKDINTKVLFFHCILKANWEPKTWRGIEVERGQFITSVDTLSHELNLSSKQIRIAIDKLKRANEIDVKTTNKFSLITVEKYDVYQNIEDKKGKQNGIENGVKKAPKTATTKQYNKLKILDIDMSIVPEELQSFLTIAQSYQKLFIKNLKDKNAPATNQENATFENYVTPIRLMIENDKVTVKDLQDVYVYLKSPNAEFWKKNILSTSKLRQQITKLLMAARPESKNENNNTNHTTKVAFKFSIDETDIGGIK